MAEKSTAEKAWDARHLPTGNNKKGSNNNIPRRLYTDENPATTIKGLGYKNRRIAERTIRLTSQPGVRYKQYWTIKAMRERARYHAHPTPDMNQAVEVLDAWLDQYQPPSPEERREQEQEWKEFQRLCRTVANQHSYGRDPTQRELDRARRDLQTGRNCLWEGLKLWHRHRHTQDPTTTVSFPIPITAYTALFGGPGLHGYGRHRIDHTKMVSNAVVEGKEGLEELTTKFNKSQAILVEGLQSINISYNLKTETAIIQAEFSKHSNTLKDLWNKAETSSDFTKCTSTTTIDAELSWTCPACTFEHTGKRKQLFLACELCATPRLPNKRKKTATITTNTSTKTLSSSSSPKPATTKRPNPSSVAWGSLKPPSEKDIRGRYKRHKGLDAPPPLLEYIVVLDFEWTADNTRKMEPIPEITQFPSVVMQLIQKKKGIPLMSPVVRSEIPLPRDLTTPSTESFSQDAFAISAFDTFVKPTLNPSLTKFSIQLTAITQQNVDAAPSMAEALRNYVSWLQDLDLVDSQGNRKGNWCFATWGDGDIMSVLRQELQYKHIPLPACFDKWINLKSDSMFKKHYGREPRGGLRSCVESLGAVWEGRAHNGLVDSINTAKVVRHMTQTGFRFVRPTRGLRRNGVPFGREK